MQLQQDSTFGQWVKQRRKWLDLTQLQLATRVGCAVITLQKIEANTLRPSGLVAKRLAEALHIPPEERDVFAEAARTMRPRPPTARAKLPTAPQPSTVHLLGREHDVDAVSRLLLQADIRLFTLAGAPGVGKTSLATGVADHLRAHAPDAFVDGICFVSLAEIQDANRVGPAIARALNLKDAADQQPHEQLQEFLHDKKLLLILDNFEHVLPAAYIVEALLAATPGLKVLVTSRTLLKLHDEREFQVSPLALPHSTQSASVTRLLEHAAIALFVERARQANPNFTLTAANAQAVAEICIRLDGLPLAIELAAARCRFIGPTLLLQHLQQRLPLLETRAAHVPERQRRLRDAIGWSYGQLEPEEQTLFKRLGVFVGGWTTPAVEAISDPSQTTTLNLLDQLAALVDNSLVLQKASSSEHDDGPRFAMLETLREFALEQLAISGEQTDAQRRHAAYMVTLAREHEMQMLSPRQAEVLARLDREHDNFRAALSWALTHDGTTALELSGRLYFFWQLRSYFREGRRWLEQAVALNLPTETNEQKVDRARALYGLGTLAYFQSDYASATPALEQALVLRRALGDKRSQATLLNGLGQIADEQGALDQAEHLWEQGFTLAQSIDDKPRMTATLSNLGVLAFKRGNFQFAKMRQEMAEVLGRAIGSKYNIATTLNELGNTELKLGDAAGARLHQEESLALAREIEDKNTASYGLMGLGDIAAYHGDFKRAQALYEESLAMRRELDNRWGMGIALARLGHIAYAQNEYGRAVALLQESLSLLRTLGDRAGIAMSLSWLGQTVLAMGHVTQAQIWHTEALALQREIDDKSGIVLSLMGFAEVAAALGEPLRAAQLWAAAETLRDQLGEVLPAHEQVALSAHFAAARGAATHGTAEFDANWSRGRTLSLEEISSELPGQPSKLSTSP